MGGTMSFRKRAGILFLALSTFLVAAHAKAQCFRGESYAVCPAKDTIYLLDDKSLGALSVSEKKIKWQIKLPRKGDGSFLGPVATPDAVVVYAGFPDTRIYAFDTATGHPIWHLETSSRDLDSFGFYILANDPKFWDGLTALDGKTGKRVWHHPAKKRRTAAPTAPERVLLTKYHAIDADTGQVLQDWPKGWDVFSKALASGIRAIGTRDGQLAAYSRPGYEMRWTRRDSGNRLVAGLEADETNLLVVWYDAATDYDLYHGEFYRPGRVTLQLLTAASGAIRWSKEIDCDWVLPSAAALVEGEAVFVKGESLNSAVVEAFDANSGLQKWIVHTDRRLTDGPVCAGEHCYMRAISSEVLMIDSQSGARSWLSLPKE
jgi:outer membrane protein assembly factor BamB